jgi:transposase
MGKIKEIHLSMKWIRVLEHGYKHGRAHFLRQRCLVVLLKAQGLSFPKIAENVDFCQQSINKWVDRFILEGIARLENRPGQGSNLVISKEAGEETIRRQAIEADRQSVKAAKATWEAFSGKTTSDETFGRFLSALVRDINV